MPGLGNSAGQNFLGQNRHFVLPIFARPVIITTVVLSAQGWIEHHIHPPPAAARGAVPPVNSPHTRLVRWWRTKPGRIRLAVALLVAVGIGWPATAIAQAVGVELFEQVMLALSWLAPALTAVDILFTAQVHERQDQADGVAPEPGRPPEAEQTET
jgi:uncharacterized membrane protein YfcA